MIIGYALTASDNDSHMTGSCKTLFDIKFLPKCSKCGYGTDYRFTDRDFNLKRKTLDFSYTYDGVAIVSLKFKEFCHRNGYKNLIFEVLPKATGFFHFFIEGNILKYEARLSENWCPECSRHESVVGPRLVTNIITNPLPDGFYQSDKWFGSGNEKSPVLIISPETKRKLAVEKIKNLTLKPI